MQTYTVRYVEGTPDWDQVEKAVLDHAHWLERPGGLSAAAQLVYDKDTLKLRLSAREKHILARAESLTDYVHIDSALEFFICPVPGDTRYFHFEFNPKGTILAGFGYDRPRLVRLLIPDYRTLFRVEPRAGDGEWEVRFVVPASLIKIIMPAFKLEKGLVLKGNFYKCGDETKEPHYLAWSPIHYDTPEYHRPVDFGELHFE
jgi:hypothetical protein